ncbi:MAG: formylglycine-generating enzyme family protein [Solirubrobacterales bacterium]|nr:formylglycine-generating enzyme family protein [Solirubrobacterales bacterium]MBV9806924.1 formylglycine-generating enzyme family protein [Solirubrobacterales bacterium]
MIKIPAGRFRMGSTGFYAEEAPARDVEVDAFAIDRGPVTVAQYTRFVDETGYPTVAERPPDPSTYPDADPSLLVAGSAVFHPTPGPVPLDDAGRWWAYVPGASWRHPWGPNSDNSQRQDHPVTHVAYEDAAVYAEWVGKALPTEAEWEYAARGGLHGATFAWGDDEYPAGELVANFWQGDFPWRNTGAKGWRGTTPVGLFAANGYDLFDMTGNVWEWTTDYYSPRGAGSEETRSACCVPPRNPHIDTADASYDLGRPGGNIPRRVIKGGSHLCAPSYCLRYRPAARQPEAIDTSTSHIGFRCILR